MPKGISLAGGYGAEGAGLGLEKIIEQRLLREKFLEAQRQAQAQEAMEQQRNMLAQQQFGYVQQRDTADREMRTRERGEDRAESQRRFDIERSEFDTAAQERQFNREMGVKEKGEERELRAKERKEDRDFESSERAKDRASRGTPGSNRTVKISYADPETGQVFEEYVTPDEARKRGPIRKGMSAKDVEAGNAMSDYVKKIDQAIALGDKSNWAGTGFFVGRAAGAFGGKFASEEGLKLRGLIGDLFAENAHERFGGALTPQEIERAKSYLAEATDDPKKIRVNLQRMREVVAPALERWQARKSATAPGDGGGNSKDPLGIR